MTRLPRIATLLFALACCTGTVLAQAQSDDAASAANTEFEQAPSPIEQGKSAALSLEQLKKKVIALNRDLFILEEDLLFPANTQFAVFVGVDAGEFLKLDAIKLKVNGDIVASHLYTERQLAALVRGGMQRLHMGNLKTGAHEITVFVEGIGPDQRPYKKAATYTLEKDSERAALEVRIKDRSSDYQPDVAIVQWD